jgi:hypothetical protein
MNEKIELTKAQAEDMILCMEADLCFWINHEKTMMYDDDKQAEFAEERAKDLRNQMNILYKNLTGSNYDFLKSW